MTQIIKDLNAEEVRIEEPAREEKNEGCKKIKLKNAKLTVVRVFDKINKNKVFNRRRKMGSVYKIVEIVGTSEKSWEDAARVAVETASKSIKELRIAEVKKLDIKVEKDGRITFRTKLDISFKYMK